MDKALSLILIEDDKDSCEKFTDYFEEIDDMLLAAITNTVPQAIEYIKDYLPDVIILDLELHKGEGNGLFLLNELKQLDIRKTPYILITTNNSSPITHEITRQLGADFIMSKHQNGYSAKSVVEFLRIMKPTIYNRMQKINPPCDTTIKSKEYKAKRINRKISNELNHIGISPKLVGYQYLVDAIELTINDPSQNLCAYIAKKYHKTDTSVQRSMQNAINCAWRRSDIDDLLFHYTAKIRSDKGVPTLTEFIYYYAYKIKDEL
ncbi:MAG: response regulator [Lachnospiraceae bacterium]|nr:response regulator [Lachnospiraceae bacterium]